MQCMYTNTMDHTFLPTSSSIPWVEKYRPTNVNDVVLDSLNREFFEKMIEQRYFPNLLIYGPPGSGKTTIIQNIIHCYQIKFNRINKSNIIHLNASDERGIDVIRTQIYQFVRSKNLFESGLKFVILDEVDYMTKNAQQALKQILQSSYNNVRFCLMCNYITKIDESLKNEFICIRFNQLPKQDVLTLIKKIVMKENLIMSEGTICAILKMFHSDIRSMINYIQLNQTIDGINKIIDDNILQDIHNFIHLPSTKEEIFQYIYNISITCNVDLRSIIHKYLSFIIQNYPTIANSHFLKSIEIILHRHDIPMDVHINYLFYLLSHNSL